jgi:ABC-type polysaccharide/polyol phosphate export permease
LEAATTQSLNPPAAAAFNASAWDLLLALTARDIKARYQGTFFSFIWWIARPLAMGLVLYFALGRVLRFEIPSYGVFIMSGLFAWFWFSGSLSSSASSIVGNAGMIKKVPFPRLILPLSAVFFNTVQFALTLPILTFFVLISGLEPSAAWLAGIPILVVTQLIILIGMGVLLSAITVFFRDLAAMLEVALVLVFYLTPIIYPLERVPPEFRPYLNLNPIAPLIDAWHELFVGGTFSVVDLWPSFLFAGGFLVVGLAVFRRLEGHFADAL